jgi:hypothetical protein
MSDLRAAAAALLQTAQIHQRNFEIVSAELQILRQRQQESDQRFEVMLAELRQLKIDSDARFNGFQTEIQHILDRLLNQSDGS